MRMRETAVFQKQQPSPAKPIAGIPTRLDKLAGAATYRLFVDERATSSLVFP